MRATLEERTHNLTARLEEEKQRFGFRRPPPPILSLAGWRRRLTVPRPLRRIADQRVNDALGLERKERVGLEVRLHTRQGRLPTTPPPELKLNTSRTCYRQ